MREEHPLLYFNFQHKEKSVKSTIFTNPISIIQTNDPNKVEQCLHKVQQAIHDQFYVAGFISYEASASFYPNLHFKQTTNIPLVWFGIFTEPSDVDLTNKRNRPFQMTTWKPKVSIDEYNEKFDRIYSHIVEGETEQVNYTIQMESNFSGEPFSFYKQLEQAQSANYTAYIDLNHFSILSASPELFFHLKDNHILMKPMKGTVERGLTYEEDHENAIWLKHSQKNQHENELIIQLMKKELQKIAKPNTTLVPKKFEIEKYPTVYQMTSTVTAEVEQSVSMVDLFKSLFPCGSITGIPKDRTIELIHKYEQHPRGIYCGAIGFITPDNEAIFNVPIRTVLLDHHLQKATYGVGGAITIDSTKEDEYNEIVTKAKVLTAEHPSFNLLETIGLQNGKYILLEHHLARIKKSASYFDYPFDEVDLRKQLSKIAEKYTKNNYRVRVLLDQHGKYFFESDKVTLPITSPKVTLATKPIQKDNPFLYHKTTNRTIYEEHKQSDFFDVLLWNEQEHITEFTTGNIVLEFNGELVTPPITCGLLPGTFRQSLLEKKVISEKVIRKSDLQQCENIWYINSVRKWIKVKLI